MIQETVRSLNQTLDQHMSIFQTHQSLHFDWLDSVKFQLHFYDDAERDSEPSIPKPTFSSVQIPAETTYKPASPLVTIGEQEKIRKSFAPKPICRSVTSPVITSTTTVRFVDDSSMLLDTISTSSDDEEDSTTSSRIPFTVSGSYSQLSESANSFNAHWQEILEIKRAQTSVSPLMPALVFEDDEVGIPTEYQMTDDEDIPTFQDDEIYDRNPFEIHGKVVPLWARQDELEEKLKEQTVDIGDAVFKSMSKTVLVSKIFGSSVRSENDPVRENNNAARKRAILNL